MVAVFPRSWLVSISLVHCYFPPHKPPFYSVGQTDPALTYSKPLDKMVFGGVFLPVYFLFLLFSLIFLCDFISLLVHPHTHCISG
ncbi:uncharacterized protein BO88DRAFT_40050 [Aspergillus vadensis CBS 113365]|uniref:Uncharacterized protein n=1 Tax=Aspergillus vadensis (strain CBS 113365 / IMI 142717 / IBT 24658) TaxID=1448311 RepID=A0A319BCR3_ASPVC|nr:hypothetical protein BO88DRAFT_40050 [Aspergillus vadensis CBS 113365]PYH69714.1 hypothetical protein BO88DRAFT_40050 [Aspergillus vadensis CBS 113365]